MKTGIVFDIKRFAVHDGPGIRTSIFTNGCPLRCTWCQNPEGQEKTVRLWYFENRCIQCHRCIEVCPQRALSIGREGTPHIRIEYDRCNRCGLCIQACPTGALAFASREMRSEEVVEEGEKDRLFYEVSGGGITITGGDPFFQDQFNMEVLTLLKKRNLHTTIETCLAVSRGKVAPFLDVVDLFIADIKLFDSQLHKKHTGSSNELIMENFHYLASHGVPMRARIPLIPEVTATDENVRAIARFVHRTRGDIPVELINFNPLAVQKYRVLGRTYQYTQYQKPFPDDTINHFTDIVEEEGLEVVKE